VTPCKKVCRLDDNMWYCKTCFRTVNEISNWIFYTDEQKCAIMHELEQRKEEYEAYKRHFGDE